LCYTVTGICQNKDSGTMVMLELRISRQSLWHLIYTGMHTIYEQVSLIIFRDL